MIPFRRDVDFMDRSEILDQVHKIYCASAGRAALFGMGGVGKSQLAIEYAFRVHEDCPRKWVFWVLASTVSRFEQDYRKIADILNLPGEDDRNTNVLRLVGRWLSDQRNGNWLLVLDNADDARVFERYETSSDSVQSVLPSHFIPQNQYGAVLVTTRSRAAALNIVGRSQDVVRVDPMDETHAVALLSSRLDDHLAKAI